MALLESGDVGDAVVFRKVVGGGGAVPAAIDNHGVVGRFRLRAVPGQLRARLPAKRPRQEA